VRYFSRQLKWGRYKNIIFPTNISVSSLPQNLVKSTFTDVKDADGAKFIYEELPKLRQIMDCEVTEAIEKLSLEQKPPIKVVTMGLDYDGSLKASLEFDYDGTRVAYSKASEKTPYVTIKKPKEDLLYWVKRNIRHEEAAYQMLLSCKFAPMQTNNLALEKENAIDFYNYYLKQAGDGWIFEEKDDMSFFKLTPEPFVLTADIDFASNSTDSFEVELYGTVGEEIIHFDEFYSIINEGNKYIRIKNEGFAELPAIDIYALLKSFNTFDVYKNDENKYIVKTYRAGVISEMQNIGMNLNMSRKFSKFWKQISTFSTMDNVALPKGVNADFREYQVKGFSWLWFLYQYGLNGILADDMGLGKTLQALALIQKAKEKNKQAPNLVICPTSVVFNWEAEIQKFAPGLKCLKLSGIERKEPFKEIKNYDIV
jgi:non-specific serine/threonine protein kinase